MKGTRCFIKPLMYVAGQPIQLGHDDRGLLLSRDIQGREQRGTMIVSAAFGLSECLDEAAPQRLLRQTIHLIHELQGRIPLLTTRPSISCTELAGILKIHPDSRFVQSIRNDVRFFIQTKGRLSIPKLRQEVARLYRLNSRALSSAQGAQKLACALADMPADVREWLARCNPKDRNIPTTEEVTSLATCAGAVQRLRLILSYGTDLERKGRKRPTGKRSRSVRPLLRVPPPLMAPVQTKGKKKGRPRGNAEREFVRNLGLTYLDATGKRAPYKVMHLDLHLDLRGPFSTFVHRCFELVGVPSGHVTSLINEIGKERRKAAGSETEYPKDFRAYLDERERFYSGGASRK